MLQETYQDPEEAILRENDEVDNNEHVLRTEITDDLKQYHEIKEDYRSINKHGDVNYESDEAEDH